MSGVEWEDKPGAFFDAGPIRSVERVTCYRIDTLNGKGTESDPYRTVTYWITEDAKLIVYRDPHNEP